MMLTDKGRLALLIMMRLALQEGRGFIPLATLADELDISIFAMKQPITALRSLGLIRGERGWNGGYILARPAARITLTEIVRGVERPVCAADAGVDSLYRLWDEVGAQLYEFLSSITLASLVAGEEEMHAGLLGGRRLASGAS